MKLIRIFQTYVDVYGTRVYLYDNNCFVRLLDYSYHSTPMSCYRYTKETLALHTPYQAAKYLNTSI